MLKRMVLVGALFGALGVALQSARAWLSDSQPWWDPGVVVVMVVVGALGVYLDDRRGGRARHSCVCWCRDRERAVPLPARAGSRGFRVHRHVWEFGYLASQHILHCRVGGKVVTCP